MEPVKLSRAIVKSWPQPRSSTPRDASPVDDPEDEQRKDKQVLLVHDLPFIAVVIIGIVIFLGTMGVLGALGTLLVG